MSNFIQPRKIRRIVLETVMELFDAVNVRRSVRKYLPTPVPRDVLEKIVAAAVEAPTGCNAQLKQYVIVDDPAVMSQLYPMSNALAGAPAAIVVLVDPKPTPYGEFWIQDASAAMQNMLLAATSLGYGSCWIEGAIRRSEDKLRAVLGVPENLRVWSITPIGKPAATATRPPKASQADTTHYNKFGGK